MLHSFLLHIAAGVMIVWTNTAQCAEMVTTLISTDLANKSTYLYRAALPGPVNKSETSYVDSVTSGRTTYGRGIYVVPPARAGSPG